MHKKTDALDPSTDFQSKAPTRTELDHEILQLLRARNAADKFRVAIAPSGDDGRSCKIGVYAIHGGDHFAAAVRCVALLQNYGLKVIKSPERTTEFVTQFVVSK